MSLNIVYAVRPNNKTFSTRCTKALRDALGGSVQERGVRCAKGTDLLIQWGYKKTPALLSAIDQQIPFVILDRGYFEPERVNRVSFSYNGHHGLAMEVEGLSKKPRPHPKVQQWRETGDSVIVVGQMPGDAAMRNHDMDAWQGRAATAAVDAFGKKVIKRIHPKMLERWEPQLQPLESTYDDTYCYVTFTSTTAVQTVLAGIPTVAQHRASPAYEVCSRNMARVRMPGREGWVHRLSYREYDLTSNDALGAVKYVSAGYEKARDLAAAGVIDTEGLR